jgi:phytoene dehydrogenase-like protein
MGGKVVVIGAGVGGLAIAALLAKRGMSVTVLERNRFAGGKAASHEKDGFIYDMGVHYCALGMAGPHGEVARQTGADLEFIKKGPIRIMVPGGCSDFPLKLTGPVSMIKFARLLRVKPHKLFGVLRAFLKMISIKEIKDAEPYDDICLKDFLLRYTDDDGFHTFIDGVCAILLVEPASEASAGEFLWSFSNFANKASCSYPQGGFREIALSFLRVCEQNGGKVLLEQEVESIKIENGKAVGVVTKDGFFAADVVVSNAGIKKTIALAGENNFRPEYVEWAKSLKDSFGAVTVKYALDYQPLPAPLMLFSSTETGRMEILMQQLSKGSDIDDCRMFIVCPTISDSGLAPYGKHLLVAGAMVPETLADSGIAEKVLHKMEQKLSVIFPGIEKHIIWKLYTGLDDIDKMSSRGTGDVVGLAQVPGQVGKNKPSAKMPIEGLYLVGCDAGGRGVGTEQASDSALNVSNLILSNSRTNSF